MKSSTPHLSQIVPYLVPLRAIEAPRWRSQTTFWTIGFAPKRRIRPLPTRRARTDSGGAPAVACQALVNPAAFTAAPGIDRLKRSHPARAAAPALARSESPGAAPQCNVGSAPDQAP